MCAFIDQYKNGHVMALMAHYGGKYIIIIWLYATSLTYFILVLGCYYLLVYHPQIQSQLLKFLKLICLELVLVGHSMLWWVKLLSVLSEVANKISGVQLTGVIGILYFAVNIFFYNIVLLYYGYNIGLFID